MEHEADKPATESAADAATAGTPAAKNSAPQRCGFVAIVGAPNAGKSTLVNALVGTKITIVSRKVQTTRVPVRGIVVEGDAQLVIIDTPGIFAPKRRLDRAMVGAANEQAGEADLVVLMIDAAKGADENVTRILKGLGGQAGSRILVLNKVDRVRKESLLALASDINARLPFAATFMISALDGSGVADLKSHLLAALSPGPWHYPADEITDATERLTAAEVTRERIYDLLHDEIPYATTVETTDWKEHSDGGVRIEQTIYVQRETQRRIALGEKGATIKQISMEARHEMSRMFERPVHLFLFVKVRENWENDPERYREMGLDFPKE